LAETLRGGVISRGFSGAYSTGFNSIALTGAGG
jgi:hypothetical protein